MGSLPRAKRLDKATRRPAAQDRDELGFMDSFAQPHAHIAARLQGIGLQMLCVRGNHEDHVFLDALEARAARQGQASYPIDACPRVAVLRTGVPLLLGQGPDALTLAGAGRTGGVGQPSAPPYIQPYERQQLRQLGQSRQAPDVLITHDQPHPSPAPHGSADIEQLLMRLPVAWHFYGHTGLPGSQTLHRNGRTQSVKVKELEFNRQTGALEPGCMFILEKQGPHMQAHPVPLLAPFRRGPWRYL